jgi:hypothetical protein
MSFKEYCKNPSAYSKIYTKETIDYYNSICSSNNSSSTLLYDIKSLAGLTGTEIEGASSVLLKAFSNMVLGLFTPEGMKMLGIFFGIDFAIKNIYSIVLKRLVYSLASGTLKSELTATVTKVAEDRIIDFASCNTSAICSVVTKEVISVVAEDFGLLRVLAGAGPFVEELVGVIFIIQLIGMVFDSSDPCHYNDQMTADDLNNFTNAFNKAFRESGIVAYDSITDSYGNTEYLNIWPIEYTATKFILNDQESDEYTALFTKHMAQYLSSLRINSLGESIFVPNGGILLNQLEDSHFKQLENKLASVLSDGNTVVANFIKKYWPAFLIFFFLLLIFLLYIIK